MESDSERNSEEEVKVNHTPRQAIEFTPSRKTEKGVPVLMSVDLTLERDDSIDPKELSPMQMIKSKMKSQVSQSSTQLIPSDAKQKKTAKKPNVTILVEPAFKREKTSDDSGSSDE